jgi:hypothetical protein
MSPWPCAATVPTDSDTIAVITAMYAITGPFISRGTFGKSHRAMTHRGPSATRAVSAAAPQETPRTTKATAYPTCPSRKAPSPRRKLVCDRGMSSTSPHQDRHSAASTARP